MADKATQTKPKRAKAAVKPPQPAPKAARKPAPAAAKAAPEAAGPAMNAFNALDPAQREALESLSINLARAALTAQGAIAEAALRSAERPATTRSAPTPSTSRPRMTDVMGQLAARGPATADAFAQADLFSLRYMELWEIHRAGFGAKETSAAWSSSPRQGRQALRRIPTGRTKSRLRRGR